MLWGWLAGELWIEIVVVWDRVMWWWLLAVVALIVRALVLEAEIATAHCFCWGDERAGVGLAGLSDVEVRGYRWAVEGCLPNLNTRIKKSEMFPYFFSSDIFSGS